MLLLLLLLLPLHQALRALDAVFGSSTNASGFRVLSGAGVIQGDGINLATLGRILNATLAEGFSAQNVAFGMGGGLLQRVNRSARAEPRACMRACTRARVRAHRVPAGVRACVHACWCAAHKHVHPRMLATDTASAAGTP